MKSLRYLLVLATLFSGFASSLNAQLNINPNGPITPAQAIQNILLGAGVNAFNVTYNGSAPNSQVVQAPVQEFDAGATAFPIANGFHMTTSGAPGITDPDLTAIIGAPTNGVIIEFDFIPSGNTINFNYIFASAEYTSYTCSGFNDGFGFFISGPGINGPYTNNAENVATVPNTTVPVSINTVNSGTSSSGNTTNCDNADPNWQANSIYFTTGNNTIFSSTAGVPNYNGSTTLLPVEVSVECGETYHIKLAISNVLDQALDSGVFLEGGSFSSPEVGISAELFDAAGLPLNGDTLYQGCNNADIYLIKPDGYVDSTYNLTVNLGGTAIPGTHYNDISGNYTIPPGQDTLTLNINPTPGVNLPGGSASIIISGDVINACGDTISTSDTIYIAEPPLFTVNVSDTTVTCPNNIPDVDLSFTTTGGEPPFTQVWSPGGQTTPTINVPTTAGGTTTYTVDVTDACGVVVTEEIDVTVNIPPDLDITFNANTFILCPADQASVEAINVSNAQGPVSYEWTDENGTIISTNSTVQASPNAAQSETWVYLEVTDGCLTELDSVKLELGGVDITSITTTPSDNCVGATANNGEITVTTNPSAGMTFILNGAGNTFGPQANGNFNNLVGGVNYFLTVTDPNGCQSDTSIYVDLLVGQPTFTGPLNVTDILCFGDDNGSATVENINGGGNPNPPFDLVWQNQGGTVINEDNLTSGSNDTQNGLEGGNWTVTVFDDNGCAFSETFTIIEPDELEITLQTFGEPSCYGGNDGSININTSGGTGNIGSFTFTWTDENGNVVQSGNTQQLTGEPAGEYTVTTEDNNGCTTTETYVLEQPDSIQFYINIDSVICYGDNTGAIYIDSVNVNDLDDYSFTLNPNGFTPDTSFSFQDLSAGVYSLTVTDESGNGCTVPNISLNVENPPPFQWSTLESVPSMCFPGTNGDGQVSVTVTGGWNGNYTILWSNSTNTLFSTNPTWGNRPPGTYNLEVSENETGCRWDTSLVVESIDPVAVLDVDPIYGIAPLDISAVNNSENAVEYIWFVDGDFYAITNDIDYGIDTTYTEGDTIEYCLVALNETGCTDTACQEMIIIPPLETKEPNVFTPNGDGANDIFYFPIQGGETFSCVIYDRWGKEVYQWGSLSPSDGWDGTRQNGKDATAGVYFYMMEVTGLDGTEQIKHGNIHLMRSED